VPSLNVDLKKKKKRKKEKERRTIDDIDNMALGK
jgi:hypothetical protein